MSNLVRSVVVKKHPHAKQITSTSARQPAHQLS
jgi:hypothetical protein